MTKGPRGSELLQGETIALAASAARTAGANGTSFFVGGERKRVIVLLNVTASATDAADTLDVYIDWSLDDTTWFNGGHFAQQAGNGAAKKEFMIFDASNPGTASILVTSDAAAGAVRPAAFGAYIRARWAIADSGDANQSHTFSVTAYAL
jgi:hypothetical protein